MCARAIRRRKSRKGQARAAGNRRLSDILPDQDRNPPCHISVPVEQLIRRTVDQNFVPVVDDRGVFIGIVTRRVVINYLLHPADML